MRTRRGRPPVLWRVPRGSAMVNIQTTRGRSTRVEKSRKDRKKIEKYPKIHGKSTEMHKDHGRAGTLRPAFFSAIQVSGVATASL